MMFGLMPSDKVANNVVVDLFEECTSLSYSKDLPMLQHMSIVILTRGLSKIVISAIRLLRLLMRQA